jgi:hypothetical protein
MDNQFDPTDWQGKRKDQVDYAHAATFIIIAIGICFGVLYLISTLF